MADVNPNTPTPEVKLLPEVAAKFKVVPGFSSGEILFKGKTVFLNLCSLQEVEDMVKAGYEGLEPTTKK